MAFKTSDSSTSLDALNEVCDPACFFCKETEDLEKQMALIDSKSFLPCSCRFAVHGVCWHRYLEKDESTNTKCPSCHKSVVGWKRTPFQHVVLEKEKEKCPVWLILFLSVLAVIGIVVIVTVSFVH